MVRIVIASFVCIVVVGAAHAQTMDDPQMDHTGHMAEMSSAQRQAEVSDRGKDVMPFKLSATTHVFTKSSNGGTQQVIAKLRTDADQVHLIRQHLQDIRGQFLKGDFSGPTHIHGQEMPGLAELKASKPGQIAIDYREVEGGAELNYQTTEPALATALHKWFDAQLSDHGKDAMAGHVHHSGMHSN